MEQFKRQEDFFGHEACMRQALGPGALGRPRGSWWRGRWEGGLGWGTHVNPWLFHFNVWQNPLQKIIIIIIKKRNKKKGRRKCKKEVGKERGWQRRKGDRRSENGTEKEWEAGMRWAWGRAVTERISKKETEETPGKKGKGRRWNVRADYGRPFLTSSLQICPPTELPHFLFLLLFTALSFNLDTKRELLRYLKVGQKGFWEEGSGHWVSWPPLGWQMSFILHAGFDCWQWCCHGGVPWAQQKRAQRSNLEVLGNRCQLNKCLSSLG